MEQRASMGGREARDEGRPDYLQGYLDAAQGVGDLLDTVRIDSRNAIADLDDRVAELGDGCPPELLELREQLLDAERRATGMLDEIIDELGVVARGSAS